MKFLNVKVPVGNGNGSPFEDASALIFSDGKADSALSQQKKKKKKKCKKKKKKQNVFPKGFGIDDALLAAMMAKQNELQASKSRGSNNGREEDSGPQGKTRGGKPKKIEQPKLDPIQERQKLQEYVDRKIRAVDMLRGRLESLQMKQDTMEHRIMEEKKKKQAHGGVKATFEKHRKVVATCKVLNGTLDRMLTRISNTEKECHDIVEDVNKLRKERLLFEEMQKRLKADFEEKQIEMAELLRSASNFHESRLKAMEELKHAVEKDKIERMAASEEHTELEEIIRKQESLQTDLQTASLKRRAHQLEQELVAGELDPEEEAKLRARLQALNAKIQRKHDEIEQAQKAAIWGYEEAFQKIMESSGNNAKSLGEIVDKYVEEYDEAYGLLNYVQQVQDDTFGLENQLKNLEQEMRKYQKEQGNADQNKERIKNELQSKLDNLLQHNRAIQSSIDSKEGTVRAVIAAISRVGDQFNMINHKPQNRISLKPEENDGKVIMQSLGLIELRTIELCKRLQRKVLAENANEPSSPSRPTFHAVGDLTSIGANGKGKPTSPFQSIKDKYKDPTIKSIELFGAPSSPARSKRESTISIPKLSTAEISSMFQSNKPDKEERKPIHAMAQQEPDDGLSDTKVLSLDELREIVSHTLGSNGQQTLLHASSGGNAGTSNANGQPLLNMIGNPFEVPRRK